MREARSSETKMHPVNPNHNHSKTGNRIDIMEIDIDHKLIWPTWDISAAGQ